MSDALSDKVNFNKIRYANCWEDADVLMEGLAPKDGNKILSIASGGDNSLALLKNNPELVLAIDISKPQLYLTALKQKCIQVLDREEIISFLGFKPSSSRLKTYQKIRKNLNSDCRSFFDHHENLIEQGLVHEGKLEKYFNVFAHYILPLIHPKKSINKLFAPKSEIAQIDYYKKHWNSWRWRLLFKIFFSKYIMGKYGRDPEFMKEVKISVAQFIFYQAENHLKSVHTQENQILYYILNGDFGEFLPYYLREENFITIKNNIQNLQLFEGGPVEIPSKIGNFHRMNLSNIFEYMDENEFLNIAEALDKLSIKDSRYAYWNLMVNRRLFEIAPDKFSHLNQLSDTLNLKDKGFFYKAFLIDQKL